MSDRVIATLEKNARELLQVARTTYEGHKLVDVRVYAKSQDGDPKPTKKGVTFKASMLDELIAALTQARGD
jgi:hypothetical protein